MRILLTKVGKEEIEKDQKQSLPNISNNTADIFINKKISKTPIRVRNLKHNFIGRSSNKSNILTKAGISSINNNNLYNNRNIYNNLNNNNINPRNRLPIKLIKINHSKLKMPVELKKIYEQEDPKNIYESLINRSETDACLSPQKGLPLREILSTKNKEKINDNLLNKEVSGSSLINYLQSDKTIYPSFVEKINKADNEKLFKLNKICQKYFHNELENDSMKSNIKNKIKMEYSKDSEIFRNRLRNMSIDLKGIEKKYNKLRIKKDILLEKRISYLEQEKYKILRNKK